MDFNGGIMSFILECQNNKCNLKQYYIKTDEKTEKTLQRMASKGVGMCHKCQSKVLFKIIKFKTLLELTRLFPNKKVIYTKLEEKELLNLDVDLDRLPYVTDKAEIEGDIALQK